MLDFVARWWYGRRAAKNAETRVVKAIAFFENGGIEYLKWDPEGFVGDAWEGIGCDRLELRLVQRGKKRRVVLYPGMTCDPAFPEPEKRVIINAALIPRPSVGATVVDVTKRVQKYMGNTLKSVHHMFPFDDHDDNAERFACLRTIDLAMKVSIVLLPEPEVLTTM